MFHGSWTLLEEVATKWTTCIKSDETCLERQIWSEVKTIFMFETKTFQNLCVVQLILAKNPCSIMVTGGLVNGNQYEIRKRTRQIFELAYDLYKKKKFQIDLEWLHANFYWSASNCTSIRTSANAKPSKMTMQILFCLLNATKLAGFSNMILKKTERGSLKRVTWKGQPKKGKWLLMVDLV